VAHRLTRRANALLLLDDGMTCEAIAEVLFLDDDTIRAGIGCIKKRAWKASGLWPRRQRLPLKRCAALSRTTRLHTANVRRGYDVSGGPRNSPAMNCDSALMSQSRRRCG
jgi:hypothetical protein